MRSTTPLTDTGAQSLIANWTELRGAGQSPDTKSHLSKLSPAINISNYSLKWLKSWCGEAVF